MHSLQYLFQHICKTAKMTITFILSEAFPLLGCYAVFVLSHKSVRMTYQFHLQESSGLRSFLDCLSLADRNDSTSSRVSHQPPPTVVKQPRTVKASTTPHQEPEFIMSVCPSVCMVQHISHLLRVLVKSCTGCFYWNLCIKSVWFKLDNNSRCFTWRQTYVHL